MLLAERFWVAVTTLVGFLTLSGLEDGKNGPQAPLIDVVTTGILNDVPHSTTEVKSESTVLCDSCFYPPGGSPDSNFYCDYSAMNTQNVKIEPCFNEPGEDYKCWIRDANNPDHKYDITTDYEKIESTPVGRTVVYNFEVVDSNFNADGLSFPNGKLIRDVTNGEPKGPTFPGPWIQACWGDTVNVTITNKMQHNGTSIHWHGIRQFGTPQMDGVNGITQCPIAPGDSFTYSWKAMQYGSSWYHSHYSVQYADGVQAPMTLHGPYIEDFDEAKDPILMTDWGHNSAFEVVWRNAGGLEFESILINGVGNVTRYQNSVKGTVTHRNGTKEEVQSIPEAKHWTFQRGKKYLLRLINTSFESTFVFSIDGHLLTVVESDFVPVHPYTNTSVLIGIGQRYHVIVEAEPITPNGDPYDPDHKLDSSSLNFWVRTYKADCFFFNNPLPLGSCNSTIPESDCASLGYELTGVVRYSETPTQDPLPNMAWPVAGVSNDPFSKGDCTQYHKDHAEQHISCVALSCSDETYSSLVPVHPWTVGVPSNSPDGMIGEELFVTFMNAPAVYPVAFSQLAGNRFNPLYLSYDDPVFLHVNYSVNNKGRIQQPYGWPTAWTIYPEGKYKSEDWVYLVLRGTQGNRNAHPIHLHGHDFAILQQIENAIFPDQLNIKGNNPPRRDVVLLPTNGYVIIAFKTDNPGPWLMHCHIANHASWGLANIIMERQQDLYDKFRWPVSQAINMTGDTCVRWRNWAGNCSNWWYNPNGEKPGEHCDELMWFSPDSGI